VKGGRVCFVPDKILNHLPFAALVSPATGRHLAEDYAVTLAPSAGLFVLNSEAARARGAGGRESVLSVGDPNFDRRAFPGLASLPAARGEAAAVAAVYGAPRALVGGAATKPAVESALRGAEVIHFALHAVADEQAPMSSGLLLAGGDDGSDGRGAEPAGLLRAQEVYRMRLPRARLVVLSACRSGVERYYGGEGMVGLARAFLAAGAPVVVASLWSVDSEATAELMVALHRRRVAGDSAAEALRGAQAEMIRHPDARLRHPFYWAAFAAIGGEASL
jgi:CHAT domain-containing protein